MEKLKIFLEGMGFKKNEIGTYTSLLQLDQASVLEISKNTGMHRANIYDALESLTAKGLIYTIDKPVKKYYPRNPNNLTEFIKGKSYEIEMVLEEIRTKKSVKYIDTEIGRSKGRAALKAALFGVLRMNEPIFVLGANESLNKEMGPILGLFNQERKKEKILLRAIYNHEVGEQFKKMQKNILTETKYLPKKYNSKVTIVICSARTLIINLNGSLNITEINDLHIATAYKEYFDLIWESKKLTV